jgi:GntR family transcriptional regulator
MLKPVMAVDKRSPVPLYSQLAELIKERIRRGELRPGDQLPPERELAEQAGISRMTARQAIAYLVREGVLTVKHGSGTFVAEPRLAYDALHLLGFTEEMMRRGARVTSRVLVQNVVAPPPRVAENLALRAHDSVIQIDRLRLLDESPLLLESSFIPAALCPGLEREDLATQSLYAVLMERYHLRLEHARQTLVAVLPTPHERQLLGVEPHTPMILLEGVTFLGGGAPVEYFKALYRGDRFEFQLASRREGDPVAAPAAPRLSVVLA